jgi:hypothetical protein
LIEFFTNLSKHKLDSPIRDFSFSSWRDNVYIVFGTRSLLKAVCCCSVKRIRLSGLEWTKLAYPEVDYNMMLKNGRERVENFSIKQF